MKHLVSRSGVGGDFYIDSAATDYDEIGSGMHPGTVAVLREHGIPFSDHRARIVSPRDYSEFDLIVIMDEENRRHLQRRIGDDRDGKVRLLLDFCGLNREVADPWYTGNFSQTYSDVLLGTQALLDALISDSGNKKGNI